MACTRCSNRCRQLAWTGRVPQSASAWYCATPTKRFREAGGANGCMAGRAPVPAGLFAWCSTHLRIADQVAVVLGGGTLSVGSAGMTAVKRIALGIEYCGSGFAGWQSQPHGNTVQDVLETALRQIAGHPRKNAVRGPYRRRGARADAGRAFRQPGGTAEFGLGARRQ